MIGPRYPPPRRWPVHDDEEARLSATLRSTWHARRAARCDDRAGDRWARPRRRWPRTWRDRPHRERPGAADLREHDRRARAHRPHARPRRQPSTASGAPEREALPRIAAVYDARETRSSPRAAAPGLAPLHELRPRRRQARRRREEAPVRDQPAPGRRSTPSFSQNVLADEDDYVARAREGGRPRRPARVGPRRRGRRGRVARAQGKWAITNTRSSHGAVPHLLDRRDLREKVWRTYVNRGDNGDDATTTPSSPRSSRCAPSARSCSATRPTPTGGSRTRWPRRRSAPWS